MIYEDNKIVPFCPSCGTPLSSHEVALGYREVEDPSVFIKFKIKNDEDVYFLAWTTTPWTLISNVALVVHPDYKYVKILLNHQDKTEKGPQRINIQRDEYLILAKARLDVIKEKYKIVEEYKGSDLKNIEYEQLFPFVIPDKKAFYVVLGDYVTM